MAESNTPSKSFSDRFKAFFSNAYSYFIGNNKVQDDGGQSQKNETTKLDNKNTTLENVKGPSSESELSAMSTPVASPRGATEERQLPQKPGGLLTNVREELAKRNVLETKSQASSRAASPSPSEASREASPKQASPAPSEASRKASKPSLKERWGEPALLQEKNIFVPPQSSSTSTASTEQASPAPSRTTSPALTRAELLAKKPLSAQFPGYFNQIRAQRAIEKAVEQTQGPVASNKTREPAPKISKEEASRIKRDRDKKRGPVANSKYFGEIRYHGLETKTEESKAKDLGAKQDYRTPAQQREDTAMAIAAGKKEFKAFNTEQQEKFEQQKQRAFVTGGEKGSYEAFSARMDKERETIKSGYENGLRNEQIIKEIKDDRKQKESKEEFRGTFQSLEGFKKGAETLLSKIKLDETEYFQHYNPRNSPYETNPPPHPGSQPRETSLEGATMSTMREREGALAKENEALRRLEGLKDLKGLKGLKVTSVDKNNSNQNSNHSSIKSYVSVLTSGAGKSREGGGERG